MTSPSPTKRVACGLLFLFLSTSSIARAQSGLMQPSVDVQHYVFRLAISDGTNAIAGETTVTLRLTKDNVESFWLDLIGRKQAKDSVGMRVLKVSLNGQKVGFSHRNDRLYVSLPYGQPKQNMLTLLVQYDGIPADGLIISKNKYGDRTFFGDNWPNRARNWLPVVDHPSDKATCEFQVIAPAHYRVISNGKLIEESRLPDGQTLTHWQENVPIPTKVMVIGAARFALKNEGDVGCIEVQSWVYPQDRQAGFVDYAPAKDILSFFIKKLGPYSYEKLANVESKTIFGGMENASCIFYTENAITGKPSSKMVSLLAHEIAHQWFGNSATEKDWPHVWLSESFATYCSALYLEHAYGPDTLNAVMAENKGAVLKYAKISPNTSIVDSTRKELMQLLNPNSYEKGAWVLHALRRELGDEMFWKGISAYYQSYQNSNASTEDLINSLEQSTGRPLRWFFEQWIFQPGFPELESSWRYDAASQKLILKVEQKQASKLPFKFPLDIKMIVQGKPQLLRNQRIENRMTQVEIPLSAPPTELILDPERWILMLNKTTKQ